jgi:Na+-driven multidrug efflux pump
MLKIGLPVGAEFALMFVYLVFVYDLLRPFGSGAQAGFGIGVRVMQSLFLPALAIGFAVAPVAGQNFGARLGGRVGETFLAGAKLVSAVMIVITLLCHIAPAEMIGFFNGDPDVVRTGGDYLRIISWNFLATGLVFVSSSTFQGMGNTLPPLLCSIVRLVLFVLPAYALSHRPTFELRTIWVISVASVVVQALLNLWLLRQAIREARPIPFFGGRGLEVFESDRAAHRPHRLPRQ